MGSDLKSQLNVYKNDYLGTINPKIHDVKKLFEAALEVKRVSAQINEVVHAIGIINCLGCILEEEESIEQLSLASGAEGEGFDLITNKRIAEFKFARWQTNAANGMRKRQVFADYVSLLIYQTDKLKELYVYDAKKIRLYFQSDRASWKKVLSKSGGLGKKLEEFLIKEQIDANSLSEIVSIGSIKILDIDEILCGEL